MCSCAGTLNPHLAPCYVFKPTPLCDLNVNSSYGVSLSSHAEKLTVPSCAL